MLKAGIQRQQFRVGTYFELRHMSDCTSQLLKTQKYNNSILVSFQQLHVLTYIEDFIVNC